MYPTSFKSLGVAALLVATQLPAFGADVSTSASVDAVLGRVWRCGPSVTLRSQALTREFETNACKSLGDIEQRFHALFGTSGKPVANDFNDSLRANIYRSRDDYERYAGTHFNIPVDNGGMYLEGLPGKPGNQAEFIASQTPEGTIRNLEHEFVHFLDARFNLYGDFCRNLHDSHSPPENCPRPAPPTPYLVWWTEGVAEYVARGTDHPKAMAIARTKEFALGELFDTGYEQKTGRTRVYTWGYLAVRFMMENHRADIETMLSFTRVGDYPRYQAVVREWGSRYDGEFEAWLSRVASDAPAEHGGAHAAHHNQQRRT